MIQSAPGNAEGESSGIHTNLQDVATMRVYYQDLSPSPLAPEVGIGMTREHAADCYPDSCR